MSNLTVVSFRNLAQPFTVTFETSPGAFYQLATGSSIIPVNFNAPISRQILLLLNFTNFTLVAPDFIDATAGLASFTS